MTDPEQLADVFGRSTEDDKLESFERSTLKLVLRRMGMKKVRIDRLEREIAEGFTFDWLQDQGWGGTRGRLVTTRCFDFDLQSLFTAPKKSALIKHLQELWLERELDNEDTVIFRANGVGRMTCVAHRDGTRVTLGIPSSVACVVVPFLFPGGDGDYPQVAGQAMFTTFEDFCNYCFTGEEIEE